MLPQIGNPTYLGESRMSHWITYFLNLARHRAGARGSIP